MSIQRGDIFYIEKSQTYAESGSEMYAGRPAIVVSNEKNNDNSSVIEIVYLTTQPKQDLPTHVAIHSTKKVSIALCEQVTSVSIDRIGDYLAKCNDSEMQMIDVALAISLGIDSYFSCSANTEPKDTAVKETVSKDEIIRLETERDVYKRLYEQMLERTVKVC